MVGGAGSDCFPAPAAVASLTCVFTRASSASSAPSLASNSVVVVSMLPSLVLVRTFWRCHHRLSGSSPAESLNRVTQVIKTLEQEPGEHASHLPFSWPNLARTFLVCLPP